MANWSNVGKHRVRIDGDVFESINEGAISLKEMQTIMEQIQHGVESNGVRFLLMNLAKSEAPSPEARRWMSQNPYEGIEAVAGYGASRTLRLMTDLMRKAMSLLSSSPPKTPFRLFETEVEARAFLDTLRKPPP